MVAVTASLHDLGVAGLVTKSGVKIEFALLRPIITTGDVVSVEPVIVPFVAGLASLVLPPSPVGNAYRVYVRGGGAQLAWCVVIPDVPSITLGTLILSHQLDPTTMTATPADAVWSVSLAAEANARSTADNVLTASVALEVVRATAAEATKADAAATTTALNLKASTTALTAEETARANADNVRIAVDAAQTFTEAQKAQALANIGMPGYVYRLVALFDGTDETTTLQAAVTAAAGGVLIMPAKKTIKSQQITIPAAGVAIRMMPGSVFDYIDPLVNGVIGLFRAEDVAFFEIEGGKILASNATGRTSQHGLLRMKNVTWLRVQHMSFGKSSATAIHTWNVASFLIDDIDINGTYADGIHLSRGTRNGTVSRIIGQYTGDDLVAINSYTATGLDTFGQCENITISNIKGRNIGSATGAGRGVVVNGGKDVLVENVYLNSVSQAGVLVSRDTGMWDGVNVHVRNVIAYNTGIQLPEGGGTTQGVYVANLTGGSVNNVTGTSNDIKIQSTATGVSVNGVIAGAAGSPKVLLLPSRFTLNIGTPVISAAGTGRVPGWLLDAATDEAISVTVDRTELTGWLTYNVVFIWANAAAGTGDVSYRALTGEWAVGDTAVAPIQVGAATATAGAQWTSIRTVVATSVAVGTGSYLTVRPYRVATAGTDTLANDSILMAVILEQAS